MSDASLTIPLDKEIEHNGTRYTELTFREPTLGEVEDMMKKPVAEQTRFLLSCVSGANPLLIAKLPISKSNKAAKFVMSFLDEEADPNSGN